MRLNCHCFVFGALVASSSLIALANTSNNEAQWQLDPTFLKQQVQQSMSPGRSVRTLIGHYPQSVASIVSVALDTYPEDYKEILHTAISAQPSSVEEIVTIAVEKGITKCSSIVETAIKAEPSYVSFVARAATNASPEDFAEILRIAVQIEPESADKIVQTVAKSYPERIGEILTNTISYVPAVGEFIVDALLAVFPEKADEVLEVAVRETRTETEAVERVIAAALDAGVNQNDVTSFAKKGGATDANIAAALERNNEEE